MPRSLIVVIPLPPRQLWPNVRCHWRARLRPKKSYRGDAYLAAVDAINRAGVEVPFSAATVRPTFYWPDRRKRDDDNCLASLKAAFDGLQDAGVVADDGRFTHLPPRQELDREHPRVELMIRETRAAKAAGGE